MQYKGGSTTGEKGEKMFEELTKLFPPGSVTGEGLRKVRQGLGVLPKSLDRTTGPSCALVVDSFIGMDLPGTNLWVSCHHSPAIPGLRYQSS